MTMPIPMIFKTALTSAVLFSSALLTTTDVAAISYPHVDKIASRMERTASQLDVEAHQHFRHTRERRHIIADVHALEMRTRRFHKLAHGHASVHRLSAEIRQLDSMFHHLEDLIDRVHSRPYGHTPVSHGRHAHGGPHYYQTGHHVPHHSGSQQVRRLMKRLENDIHHLRRHIAKETCRGPSCDSGGCGYTAAPGPYRQSGYRTEWEVQSGRHGERATFAIRF